MFCLFSIKCHETGYKVYLSAESASEVGYEFKCGINGCGN